MNKSCDNGIEEWGNKGIVEEGMKKSWNKGMKEWSNHGIKE